MDKVTEVDQGKTSKFNAAVLQMQRIHDLQERLNRAKINPLAYSEDVGLFNYEIILNTITALYLEVEPKLSKVENEKGLVLKEAIEDFLEKTPVHFEKKTLTYPYRPTIQFNKQNWESVRKVIFFYESLVRDFLEIHGMNSPPNDDPRFAAYG